MSVLVEEDGTARIVTKGALDNVLAVCTHAELPTGEVVALAQVGPDIRSRYESLSGQGYRVLGVATREVGSTTRLAATDESDLMFCGSLTFLDPPKPGADATLRELAAANISVRVITGDNRLVAAHVGAMVGLDPSAVLTGEELDRLDDATRRGDRAGGRLDDVVAGISAIRPRINPHPQWHWAALGSSLVAHEDVTFDPVASVAPRPTLP